MQLLSPVHTKNDNYKDNDSSVHTSKLYCLFILSACASAALNSRAHYSRMDSDWLFFVFLSFISWKIVYLCLYHYRAWCERAFTDDSNAH